MKGAEIHPLLVRKYNQPVPRYTSYPTVPFWTPEETSSGWQATFRRQFEQQNAVDGISLYLHLPFCESLCTYCGCNKKITTNHAVEPEYLQAIEKEWTLYRRTMNQTPVIREIHLGGGTPTFFSPSHLRQLLTFILKSSIVHPAHEFSVEGHPNNTTAEHLAVLYELGFRRISLGVQDNDPQVQRIINRVQPFSNVTSVTRQARSLGYHSVNYDLIYGLPLQTTATIRQTIREVISENPDRIAFYSYAHVPWTSKGQRLFCESDLPAAEYKLQLYMQGKEQLMEAGYEDVGMDHFAQPADALYQARTTGRLHRNFMGYTTQRTGLLLGLGVSSISDSGLAYVQNEKALHDYYRRVAAGQLPVARGYLLSEEDRAFKQYILDLACRGTTVFRPEDRALLEEYSFPLLQELSADGLVQYTNREVTITRAGHYFIRNICSAFDLHLQRSRAGAVPSFSQAI